LRVVLKKSLTLQRTCQESAGVMPEVSESSARMATTPAREVPPLAASMGEQIEEGATRAPMVDVVRLGAAAMSQVETAQLEPSPA
jgi:hypothetical protein